MKNNLDKAFYCITPTQYSILEHRLSIPDAIAECLTSESDGKTTEDGKYTWKQVEQAATALNKRLKKDLSLENLSELEEVIVKDCMDGSTFFADAWDAANNPYPGNPYTKGKYYYEVKSAEDLERKLNDLGIECSIPLIVGGVS